MNVLAKFFIPILFLIPLTSFGQENENVVIANDLYTIVYSQELEQPLHILYEVLCPMSGVSRSGINFWEPDGIKTSDDDDYYNNIWDKGHMVPAAAFDCTEEMLYETFSYANSALQHQNLNRGAWRELEEAERILAYFSSSPVNVEIDVIFEDTSEKLDSGATVPSAFRKTLIVGNSTFIFLFPNEDTKGKRWQDFSVEQSN